MKKLQLCLLVLLCAALMTAPAQAQTASAPGHGGLRVILCSVKACPQISGTPAIPTGGGAEPAAVASNRTDLASEVIRQVNAERSKAGLGALRVDVELTRAACVRAAEIVRKFSHTRPDGSAWSTVSSRVYGENIAMGQRTADKVMAAWMSSAGHRANILRSGFGSIGVCAATVNGVTYWVQLFGK